MAQSDATGWDKFVDGGQMRLLVTFGEAHQALAHRADREGTRLRRGVASRRTASSVPRAWTRPSSRPFTTRSGRRWTIEAPGVARQLNQDLWYRSGEDYAKWARRDLRRTRC